MGKTILISSHILPELQDLCNTVGIIERGELIYSGPWTDIVKKARGGTMLHVAVADNAAGAAALLAQDAQRRVGQPERGGPDRGQPQGRRDRLQLRPGPARRRRVSA